MKKSGFGLLEIVLVAAIVIISMLMLINLYLKKPMVDQETGKALREQNIDTSNYKTTLESVRRKVQDIQKKNAAEEPLE